MYPTTISLCAREDNDKWPCIHEKRCKGAGSYQLVWQHLKHKAKVLTTTAIRQYKRHSYRMYCPQLRALFKRSKAIPYTN